MFQQIKIPSEKKRILSALVTANAELIIKNAEESVLRVPVKKIENGLLSCDGSAGQFEGDLNELKVIYFTLGTERYFFYSVLKFGDDYISIDANSDLFHLQRRKNVRLNLPDEVNARCSIIQWGTTSGLVEAKVLDFSAGGLRLEFSESSPLFFSNDVIKLVIRFGNRRELNLEGVVRHVMPRQNRHDSQTFGVQFLQVDKFLENKLMSLQLDIQSEIFRKWKHAL